MPKAHGMEIDGKRYVSTSVAASWWGLKPKTVAQYCKDGRIPGAGKDLSNHWCIPVGAFRPLAEEKIRQVLRLTLTLKNNPDLDIDYAGADIQPDALRPLYRHLAALGYIRPISDSVAVARIPYDAGLTQKGMDFVLLSDRQSATNDCLQLTTQIIGLTKALAELALVFTKI